VAAEPKQVIKDPNQNELLLTVRIKVANGAVIGKSAVTVELKDASDVLDNKVFPAPGAPASNTYARDGQTTGSGDIYVSASYTCLSSRADVRQCASWACPGSPTTHARTRAAAHSTVLAAPGLCSQ